MAIVTTEPAPDIADISANGRCLNAITYTPTSANSSNATYLQNWNEELNARFLCFRNPTANP